MSKSVIEALRKEIRAKQSNDIIFQMGEVE